MNMRKLGIAVAIASTLGFSCHNEPNYARVGMSNPPGGSGSGPAVPAAAPVATPAPAAPAPATKQP